MSRELLLFSIGDATFGVWEDEVSSVGPARPIHRLPLSPGAVAGMSLIDGRGATIFDLAACLGMRPRAGVAAFLLIEGHDGLAGFAVSGATRGRCAPDSVLPLPDAVRTAVLSMCAVSGGNLIPIINIRDLHERLGKGLLAAPQPEPFRPNAEKGAVSSVRLFTLGGKSFCIDADGTSPIPSGTVQATVLESAGPLVRGIILHGNELLPVVSVSGRMGIPEPGPAGDLLVAAAGEQRCCLVVDRDLGTVDAGACRISALPPIARTAWMRSAAVMDGMPVPLIDLAELLGSAGDGAEEGEPSAAYAPSSDFPLRFRRNSAEVTEFSLLGVLHALPRSEVKDVLLPAPYRAFPGMPLIVAGIAELKGELLPVLDMATIFGRRSAASSRCRMLEVKNGDFHALVYAEEAGEERVLPVEMQRQVPVSLPYQVLYGCYLDGGAVRLILNVESLAVHFEKTEIRDLVQSLVPLPAEVPVQEEPEIGRGQQTVAGTAAGEEDRLREEALVRAREEAGEREEKAARAAAEEARRIAEEAALHQQEAARIRAEAEAREQEAAARRRAEEEARVREETARAEAEARERTAEDARRKAEEERLREEAAARARAEAEARELEETAARAAAEVQARRKAEDEERRRTETEARDKAEAEAREREETAAKARAVQEEQERRSEEERRKTEEEARRRSEARLREVLAQELPTSQQAGPGHAGLPEQGSAGQRTSRRLVGAAAGIAVLALLLWWAGSEVPHPAMERPAQMTPPAALVKEPDAPLYVNVPPSMPKAGVEVYVVVKGDTLWGIAKRFTGDPLNYPRVAKDNSIATPDLIFPGQRIRLVPDRR